MQIKYQKIFEATKKGKVTYLKGTSDEQFK